MIISKIILYWDVMNKKNDRLNFFYTKNIVYLSTKYKYNVIILINYKKRKINQMKREKKNDGP